MTIRAALLALLVAACAPPSPSQSGPGGRSANSLFAATPDRQITLPSALREISGMAATSQGRIFAHDDERAVIYEIDIVRGLFIRAFSLGTPPETGDYEGLAITPDGVFYLITSTGALSRFREGNDREAVAYQRMDTGLRPACEVEGLAYLVPERSLVIACKRGPGRAVRDTISLFLWREGDPAAAPWRSISERALTRAAGVERFRPSSVEIDSASGRVLLLSARDAALAEFSAEGVLIAARALNSSHIQAESLAITAGGALLIGDEGGAGSGLLSEYGRIQ